MARSRKNTKEEVVETPEVEEVVEQQEPSEEEVKALAEKEAEEQAQAEQAAAKKAEEQAQAAKEAEEQAAKEAEEQAAKEAKVKAEQAAKKAKEEANKPKPDLTLKVNEVKTLLENGTISIEDKLKNISAHGAPAFKSIVNKIVDYNNKMKPGALILSEKVIASNNFDLYNLLINIVSTPDYATFKVRMDLLNILFVHFKNESLDEFKLHRADTKWTWGEKSLTTYQYLITMLSILADRSTRDNNIKQISFEKLFADSTLTPVAKDNITKYYS